MSVEGKKKEKKEEKKKDKDLFVSRRLNKN